MNKNYPYYDNALINNLSDLLNLHLDSKKDDTAFLFRGTNKEILTKTYNDFYRDVTGLKKYLYSKYQKINIAIIGENSYNFILLFMGIVLSGNTAVIIDKDLDIDTINTLLKKSDVKLLFYSKSYNKELESLKLSKEYIDNVPDLIELGQKFDDFNLKDNKSAAIFFTSGTTGFNKGVVLSEKNIVSDIVGASALFKPNGSAFALLPFHHTFGFITAVLKPIYYGVPLFLNSSLKNVLGELKISKPNTLFVVPAFIEVFYKEIWKNARKTKQDKKLKMGIKLSNMLLKLGIDIRKSLFKDILKEFGGNLEYIICGGAFLDEKYIKWFKSIGITILNGYGITECSPVVAVNRNNFIKSGSVGHILPNIKVKIEDNEICVKGDIVMQGYYKDLVATKKVIKDGWFHTGDLGYIDSDGFLFINGRKNNLIVLSNGENILPEQLEEELLKDKGVREVVVYQKNNKLIASIYPNDEYLGNREYFNNLIDKYNKKAPINHKIAFVTVRMTEHIKNNNKKILRNRVEE